MNLLARGFLTVIALAAPVSMAYADFAAGVTAFQNGDYVTAHEEWRPLAEQGNAAAQHNLGTLYNYGLGRDKDLTEAADWYLRAAQSGNANAQTKIGIFLAQGLGLERDFNQAAGWFREAAEQQHAEAQYNLGVLYATGSGLELDRVQALMWLTLAHEAGVEQAAQPRDMLMAEMPPDDVEEAALLAEIMRPPGQVAAPMTPTQVQTPADEPEKPIISIQLASYESEQAAAEGWAKLRQIHGDLLDNLNYGLAAMNLGQQVNFFRLYAGPFESEEQARDLCLKLKARNIYCATTF